MDKSKITVEIPAYLKDWLNKHDLGQNTMVTFALRHFYMQEKTVDESLIVKKIVEYFETIKLPF